MVEFRAAKALGVVADDALTSRSGGREALQEGGLCARYEAAIDEGAYRAVQCLGPLPKELTRFRREVIDGCIRFRRPDGNYFHAGIRLWTHANVRQLAVASVDSGRMSWRIILEYCRIARGTSSSNEHVYASSSSNS